MNEETSRRLNGLAMRRKVLGEEYVNRATKDA
jgi:hypothetical protein